MPPTPRHVVVAISEHGRRARKVAKLIVGRDASVYVTAPYLPTTPGIVSKAEMPVVWSAEGSGLAHTVEAYRVEDTVKLAVHASGFVQFSSARAIIRSGRDPVLGIPKGLGLYIRSPLLHPIDTGPTFAVVAWGLSSFQPAPETWDASLLAFAEGEFFEREYAAKSRTVTYVVEGFYLPRHLLAFAHNDGRGRRVLTYRYSVHRPDWIVDFRIVELPTPFAVLALLVSRYHGLDDRAWDGPRPPFGVTIDSPRDLTERYQLSATYPLAPHDPGPTELLPPYGAA